jgi:hypothetical protein
MKQLTIILLNLLSLSACSESYNVEKDKLVNYLIDSKPVKVETHTSNMLNMDCVEIYYSEYKITIFHYKHIEYKQSESWEYFMHNKSGEIMMISSNVNIPKNMISESTYLRLRELHHTLIK